jgi:hypothetical protein
MGAMKIVLFVCFFLFAAGAAQAQSASIRVVCTPGETATDLRRRHFRELMDAALAANRARDGEYILEPCPDVLTQQRAINEVMHEDVPGMMIERRFALHYPLAFMFFVARTAAGEKMADRIRDGPAMVG